ncbi:MAG: hypothetical protein ABR502_02885 [Chitinophagaceae bacterium]
MKKFLPALFWCLFLVADLSAQNISAKDSVRIFDDDNPISVTMITDLKMLIRNKQDGKYQNALFSCRLPDSTTVSEEILIQTRGHFRLNHCQIPSLRLNFRTPKSPRLSFLKELKLVNTCNNRGDYEQLLIKEYLVYKIYNLLTDISFRVRLLRITYEDIKGQSRPFTQYAFLLENVDAMAKRNGCKELNNIKLHAQVANREQMTMVDVFQYMIGNTDWSVIGNHNIKVIQPRNDSIANPYPVPYDFDFGGLVNADYANPPPNLPIQSVRERLYRGFPRTTEELQKIFDVYNKRKDKIYSLINNCQQLQAGHKKDMISYLDEFYKSINNKKEVQRIFLDNARQGG